MKSNLIKWTWAISLLFLFSCATPQGTVTKGLIGEQDIHRWDGTSSKTFTRASSTGGTLTLNDVGYEVDALISYGGGTSYTQATIEAALTAIGTVNKVTLLIRPGTWVISSNADWSAYTNVTFKFVPGAILSYAANVTIPRMDENGMHQRFSKVSGTLSFGTNAVSRIVPQWWGASSAASAAVNSVAFQAALDSMGTYPSIPLYIPGVTVGSITPYQINVALTKTSADWIRIKGDGSSSWLEWTGANYATILSVTGEGSGNAEVDSVRFDCNNKATTGLSMNAFGHGISVTKNEFNDCLANVADDQGMLNIPVLTAETHNGLIQRNVFQGGTAIGMALGLTGAASGSGGFEISINEFLQVNNWAVRSKGLKESSIKTNIIDNLLANANGGGFKLDISSNLILDNNHAESLNQQFILLNPTARYDFSPITARITNNLTTNSVDSEINLGFTDGVELSGNTHLQNLAESNQWLAVTANAVGTIVGKNQLARADGTDVFWAEQFVTGAGLWNKRYSTTTVFSTAALLTLASQSVSADWVTLSPVSTLNAPDIPVDARGWIVQASIKSATVGARLYLFSAANLVAWGDRATDIRVQYIEAQTANRYNTATIIIPAVNQSYEDLFSYGISDGGVTDTDVELRLIGYLMPT